MEVLQRAAALREVEHVARAVDIHAHAEVALHAQVVDRGEVPDFGDVVRRRESIGDVMSPSMMRTRSKLLRALAGEVRELRLDEADGVRVRRSARSRGSSSVPRNPG